MSAPEELRGMDIYLLDQLFKGNITKDQRILDAGCGSGRNMHYFLENDFDIYGIDPSEVAIAKLKKNYPDHANIFFPSSIEAFKDSAIFDFIICNAVLHFAKNHSHFNTIFDSLINLLADDGILFIRMTSDIGLNLEEDGREGVHHLPDGSTRYLITRDQIDELLVRHKLQLIEPVKTVKVEELRSMTTLVFRKG